MRASGTKGLSDCIFLGSPPLIYKFQLIVSMITSNHSAFIRISKLK